MLIRHLLNGALSFAISVTVVLTLAGNDGGEPSGAGHPSADNSDPTWDRTDVVVTAAISAFLSGVCASYFGSSRRNYL